MSQEDNMTGGKAQDDPSVDSSLFIPQTELFDLFQMQRHTFELVT